jgi:hypothetical protein
MRHLLKLSKFENTRNSKVNESRGYEWDEPGEPDEPEISYSKENSLFETVVFIPALDVAFLKGKSSVGGGIWILKIGEDPSIPDEYLYQYYDNSEVDLVDLTDDGTFRTWATDIWNKNKEQVGSGVEDYEDPNFEKVLIKVDDPLRDLLIDELEMTLSTNYTWQKDPFTGESKFGSERHSSYFSAESRKKVKNTIFFLEKSLL